MMAGPGGAGYVLVASDGGTFTFGTAPFYGSLGAIPLKNPIAAAAVTPGDTGYWFSDSTGEVSAFGQAAYYGSAPPGLGSPVVGMAEATGTGTFIGADFVSGSYGYDVSKFNMNSPACTTGLPTGVHDIGVVEVDGESSGNANPCLAVEAAWAGAGLNLYTFLTNSGLCTSTSTCFTVGYDAGIQAFKDAQAAGVNTSVGWWLDVEGAGQYWTSSTAENAQTVLGAIDALHNTEGVADVGDLCQSGDVEHHRRQLPAFGPLLDGRLAHPPERSCDLRRRLRLAGQGAAADGTGRVRPVQRQHQRGRRRLRLLRPALLR